jgi:hypothetical protein
LALFFFNSKFFGCLSFSDTSLFCFSVCFFLLKSKAFCLFCGFISFFLRYSKALLLFLTFNIGESLFFFLLLFFLS